MDRVKIDATQLTKIEESFKQINFKGLSVGILLSYYFDRLYQNNLDTRIFRQFLFVLYSSVKSVCFKKEITDFKKEIVYFRSSKNRHLGRIENSITGDEVLMQKSLIISSNRLFGIDKSNVFFLTGFLEIIKITKFVISKNNNILNLLNQLNLSFKLKCILQIILVVQLLKGVSLKKFLIRQTGVMLVASDYDRGNESCLFYAVSNSLKIKSITFQHGVLNPPIGYSPLNADEIWVWGELAKQQLNALRVPIQKIQITGTPVVDDIELSIEKKKAALKKHKLKDGCCVVLALSSPNILVERKMVQLFAEIKQKFSMQTDSFLVKIHPARDISYYSWIKQEFNINILQTDISYSDFMNITDVLLAHTSGIATEALYFDKKVGIIDVFGEALGNGGELIKYFGITLIRSPKDYQDVLKNNHTFNKEFVIYKKGNDANIEIRNRIRAIIGK